LWFRGCSSDTKSPQIAKVTEVKGFSLKKPAHEVVKTEPIVIKGKTIYTRINQSKLIAENEKLKLILLWLMIV
jgi:hypothetical protein